MKSSVDHNLSGTRRLSLASDSENIHTDRMIVQRPKLGVSVYIEFPDGEDQKVQDFWELMGMKYYSALLIHLSH